MIKEVTLEELRSFDSVYKAIEYANNLCCDIPTKPKHPILDKNYTVEMVNQYALDLDNYDSLMKYYETQKKVYNIRVCNNNDTVIEFIKENAGIDIVPEKYREKLYSKAYDNGHGNGMHEVYLELCSLVDIFS